MLASDVQASAALEVLLTASAAWTSHPWGLGRYSSSSSIKQNIVPRESAYWTKLAFDSERCRALTAGRGYGGAALFLLRLVPTLGAVRLRVSEAVSLCEAALGARWEGLGYLDMSCSCSPGRNSSCADRLCSR